jgi:DNA polymerase-3 subunit delta
MVAFKGPHGQKVCAQPPDDINALLIYGGNAGLVRERARAAVKFAVEDLGDTFRLCELQAKEVGEDPARLADELGALSFSGGRRAVWLKDGGDKLTAAISSALEMEFGDTLLVVESGNLNPRSSLRKLFEQASNLAAVASYEDDSGSLQEYVGDFLAGEKASIERDALYWLLDRVGNDRMQVRSELEKLILFASSGETLAEDGSIRITLDTVMQASGDAGVWSFDRLADAVAGGNLTNIDRFLYLAYEDGDKPIAVIRAVARRFTQLHFVVGLAAAGNSIDKLISALRPPVFYKNRPALRAQAEHWSLSYIAQALDILGEAEIDCKTTGMPDEEICARALIRIGAAGRPGRAGRAGRGRN